MRAFDKSRNAIKAILLVVALAVAWFAFQIAAHRHTGILHLLVQIKHSVEGSHPAHSLFASVGLQQRTGNTSPGRQHSVNLSWKASTTAGVGYNVYRRGPSGLVKVTATPVNGTNYVDSTVQSGQSYFYVVKAVNPKGSESSPSNEIRADIPSP